MDISQVVSFAFRVVVLSLTIAFNMCRYSTKHIPFIKKNVFQRTLPSSGWTPRISGPRIDQVYIYKIQSEEISILTDAAALYCQHLYPSINLHTLVEQAFAGEHQYLHLNTCIWRRTVIRSDKSIIFFTDTPILNWWPTQMDGAAKAVSVFLVLVLV